MHQVVRVLHRVVKVGNAVLEDEDACASDPKAFFYNFLRADVDNAEANAVISLVKVVIEDGDCARWKTEHVVLVP